MCLLRQYGAMQKALLYETQALIKSSYYKILWGFPGTNGRLKGTPWSSFIRQVLSLVFRGKSYVLQALKL